MDPACNTEDWAVDAGCDLPASSALSSTAPSRAAMASRVTISARAPPPLIANVRVHYRAGGRSVWGEPEAAVGG